MERQNYDEINLYLNNNTLFTTTLFSIPLKRSLRTPHKLPTYFLNNKIKWLGATRFLIYSKNMFPSYTYVGRKRNEEFAKTLMPYQRLLVTIAIQQKCVLENVD